MFPDYPEFKTGVLFPKELSELYFMFKEICKQPWFSRSPEFQAEFAAFLLRSYSNGMRDLEQLREFVTDVAKACYAEPA